MLQSKFLNYFVSSVCNGVPFGYFSVNSVSVSTSVTPMLVVIYFNIGPKLGTWLIILFFSFACKS